MNGTEELGHFIFTEYDQLNFLLELDVYLNSSENLTANATLVNSFYFYEKEQLTMLWILFVSIVVGNSSVLIALLLDKGRTSRFNYFIKHLAIADLSVGFVSVLTDIIWKLTIEWNAGNVACKLAVVTYSSTYLLVALTIDRYEAIRHPMNFFKSWKRARFLVISAWILSLLFSIPIIVLYEEKTVQGHLQCWIELIEPWHWQMYMIIISLTVFFIPAFIIAGCYTTIIYTIWSHPNIPDRPIPNGTVVKAKSGGDFEMCMSKGHHEMYKKHYDEGPPVIKEDTDKEVEEVNKRATAKKTQPPPSFGGGLGVAEIVITAATPMLEEAETPFPPVPEEDEEAEEEPEKEKEEELVEEETGVEKEPPPCAKPPEQEESIEEEGSTSEAVTTIVATTTNAQLDDNEDQTDDCPTDSAPFPVSSSTGSEDDPSTGPSTAENSQSNAPPAAHQGDVNLPEELDPHQLAKLKSLKESNA